MLTRRILFVTCMALETPRSASMAFMQVLLEKYPESFVWYSLRSSKIGNTNPLNIPSSNSRDCLQFSRPRLLKNFLNLSLIAWVKGRQAAIFGKQHKVDVVMADLAFEAVVAGRVAAQVLAVPLLVSIHDDPVERIKVKGLPGWLIKWYERQFEETLRSASGCAVISDGMGEIYQQRYGVKTATLYVGVDENQCLPVRSGDSNGRPFIVGSTGSVNSAENWNMLLEAVRWLNQKHGEGSYRILHAGELRSQLKTSKDVEVTGWLPGIEFFHILAHPFEIGFDGFVFAGTAVGGCTVQASFKTVADSFINCFHAAAPVAEPRVGGTHQAVIISPVLSSCIEVAVLAVHAIGDLCHATLWSKIFGCVGDQFFTIYQQCPLQHPEAAASSVSSRS
jgi:hypothetical protein